MRFAIISPRIILHIFMAAGSNIVCSMVRGFLYLAIILSMKPQMRHEVLLSK